MRPDPASPNAQSQLTRALDRELEQLLPVPTRRTSNASLNNHNPPLPHPDGALPLTSSSDTTPSSPSAPVAFASSMSTTRLVLLFSLLVVASTLGLIAVSSFMEPGVGFSLRHGHTRISRAAQNLEDSHDVNNRNNKHDLQAFAKQLAASGGKQTVEQRWQDLGNLDDYECVGWRQTKECSPTGPSDGAFDRPCNASIENGVSGYCEIRHRGTNATKHVLQMHCDSTRPAVTFRCDEFATMLNYGRQAVNYTHDAEFSFDRCQKQFAKDQAAADVAMPNTTVVGSAGSNQGFSFERGIVIVVYEQVLESVYASIRSLRALGCQLPVELWYLASETDVRHPLLRNLTQEYGAFLREIKDKRVSRFYTKIYAVFYSAFDQVLLLDADNFAVRDPTYLFSTPEFVSQRAMFWPDFWRFKKTIFNIQPTSLVWDVFDLDVVDMFEQESGQVLIDRRRNVAALNVMMYYAFHAEMIERLRLVWGDKDLFRFSFLKTNSPFHMIEMPPGSAGVKLSDRNVFCGVTMVQHDPQHQILFLHRNMEKLSSDNRRIVWHDLQDFRMGDVSIEEYDVRGANGGRYYPQFKRCYGKDIYYESAFTVTPFSKLPFAGFEPRLLAFAEEAERIVNATIAKSTDNSEPKHLA